MVDWNKIFDNFGIKKVSKTDKTKSAYLPNEKQRLAIEAAGILPANERPAPSFEVTVLFDATTSTVSSSYYYSERSPSAERNPEPRMGHGIISSWLAQGDKVLIGNIGSQLFAAKLNFSLPPSSIVVSEEIIKCANREVIFDRAKTATGKPAKRFIERAEFIRSPFIVAAVLIRSDGKCEMPGCARQLFSRDDDSPYLEVHHVVPLSEDGDDTFINAAALCPHCHREVHYGKNRYLLRDRLRVHIETLEA